MQENTVLLNVEKYNRLRDFYIGIKEDKFVGIDSYDGSVYYPKEKHIIKTLDDRIKSLEKELIGYKHPVKSKTKTIDDVKKMSLWQFLKWRNKNK